MAQSNQPEIDFASEAHVSIGGVPLTFGQSMTLRVALTAFATEMEDDTALGNDEHGRTMVKNYRDAANAILQRIFSDIDHSKMLESLTPVSKKPKVV